MTDVDSRRLCVIEFHPQSRLTYGRWNASKDAENYRLKQNAKDKRHTGQKLKDCRMIVCCPMAKPIKREAMF